MKRTRGVTVALINFIICSEGFLQQFPQHSSTTTPYSNNTPNELSSRVRLETKLAQLRSSPDSEGLNNELGDDEAAEIAQLVNYFLKTGKPSSPGWKNKNKIDELTEWAVSDAANRPIISEYEPDAYWLWSKWRGTALSITYIPVLVNMALGLAVDRACHYLSDSNWSLLAVPPETDPLIHELVGMQHLWGYQLSFCTFILAFFTSQAYTVWRSVYFTTRAIQGRINDICMLITLCAERSTHSSNSDQIMTQFSDEAAELVGTCNRLIRLSHTFFWAATPTCSNGVGDGGNHDGDDIDELPAEYSKDAIGPVLLSPEGLRGLECAGELTHEEVLSLLQSGLPPSQYPYVLLEWVGLYALEGLRDGTLNAKFGAEDQILRRLTDLRAEYFSIGDIVAGRMPLAYVQLVQILVDSIVWLSPFALYPALGSLAIPFGGLQTLFFKGLLELSKSFLDPFGNEGFRGQNIHIDVLVSELNFGASSRWSKAAEHLPRRKYQSLISGKTNERPRNNVRMPQNLNGGSRREKNIT